MNTITVPICLLCRKPHFGRSNIEDRCICDCSGMFEIGEIEEEVLPSNTPNKDM